MRTALVALAALLATFPAAATHMSNYATNPVEHDDQGRSDEPDFARTAVLGPALENRVVDLDRDGVAVPDSQLPPAPGLAAVVAPGCWGPQGPAPSGACGVCTVGLGVWVPGALPPMEVLPPGQVCPLPPGPSPGAYTPTPQTRIRFLDVRYDAQPMAVAPFRVDANHKVADALARADLTDAAPAPALAGPTGVWAWLGDWQDRNGNGVIDHLGDQQGNLAAGNEFVWVGGCLDFGQQFRPGPHCQPEPDATLVGYAFPGEHRGQLGLCAPAATLSCAVLAFEGLPGAEAACHLAPAAPPDILVCSGATDPLLGPQDLRGPDDAFHDRTGDPALTIRGWFYGVGFSSWYYDQSLLVSHVFVAAYRAPPAPATPNGLDLLRAPFLDVDLHRPATPLLEPLLQGAVKPAARAQWEVVRELLPAPPAPQLAPPLPALPAVLGPPAT